MFVHLDVQIVMVIVLGLSLIPVLQARILLLHFRLKLANAPVLVSCSRLRERTPRNAVDLKLETNLFRGRKKTNKHKQLRGIVPEMGGGQIVYVFPFFLGKKGNT